MASYGLGNDSFIRQADEVLNVAIEGEQEPLGVTPDHPFWTRRARSDTSGEDEGNDGEWIAAGRLLPGDEVQRPSGEWVRVLGIRERERDVTVYNFQAADNHDYYVGRAGILVHNADYAENLRAKINGAASARRVTLEEVAANRPYGRIVDEYPTASGFSGAYDPVTGRVHLMPSTDSRVLPQGWVAQYGGHNEVANELIRMHGLEPGSRGRLMGFVLVPEGGEAFVVRWNSQTLNGSNWLFQNLPPQLRRTVPEEWRPLIMDAVRAHTGGSVY